MQVYAAGVSDEGEAVEVPFTEATRARAVLSAEAADLADVARAFVPIGERELRPDGSSTSLGSWVAEAAATAAAAQRVLDAAVVYERLAGATWSSIAAQLEVARQTAQERFEPTVAKFRETLHLPENPDYTDEFGQLRWRLHSAARDPEDAARLLDEWLREHHAPDAAVELGEDPVSGGLARMDADTELAWISEHSHQLWTAAEAAGTTVPPAVRLALAQRRVELLEHLAADRPRSRTTRQMLEHARRTLAELRADHPQHT